jgi:hypothetical protein
MPIKKDCRDALKTKAHPTNQMSFLLFEKNNEQV